MSRKNDKRTRLVEAADKLFYEQGVTMTTLANIATLAEVPLGNVYYYFKSKNSIVLAVIEQRQHLLKNQLEECSTLSPIDRLKALVKQYQINP
jgi:AcrR family transcriptional regulator